MPKKPTRETVLEDRAIADISSSVTTRQRELIIERLMSGKMQDDIVAELNVSRTQVMEVAESIKAQLMEVERKMINETRMLLLSGSIKAFKLLISRLDDPAFPDKMLPATAGVLFDKWATLAGTSSLSQTLVVAGNGSMEDAINNAAAIVSRIKNRVGEPTYSGDTDEE